MKKILALALSLILLFSCVALAVDARSATETARALAPEGYVYLYTEKDGKAFDVHFLNEETNEEYKVTVPADETKPIKIETENELAFGSVQSVLTEENVREIFAQSFPDVEIDTILTMMEDGLFEVHVYFKAADRFGLVEMNAENGTILKMKVILAAPEENWQLELDDDYYKDVQMAENVVIADAVKEKREDSEMNASPSFISVSEAKAAVTNRHPGAKISEIELDFDGGKYVYEGEAYLNGREYDFKVDASSGSLIKWKLDD